MKSVVRSLCFMLLVLLISCSIAFAQSAEQKYEIGFQTSYIIQSGSIRDNIEGIGGLGARFTYNINKNFSIETDANFFPRRSLGDTSVQNQIGGKFGKRFGKLGLYGKLSPGFINTQQRNSFPTFIIGGNTGFPGKTVVSSETVFSLNTGVVVQYYAKNHFHWRFDIGHTFVDVGKLEQNVYTPLHRNNLQWSVGIGFHF